jgi:phosphoribosylamine--glycine ligase
MKILVIDPLGNALDWILRCERAHHEVKLFTKFDCRVGHGLVSKVHDWKAWMRWADLIFLTDNVQHLFALEWYRERGFPIFGPSLESAKLELEREVGQHAFKQHGIEIMPYKTFTNYDQAIAHVDKERKRFVSKPSGDADKALSYVSKDPRDMIAMLDRWKKLGKAKTPFILQEFVSGIEMAVGCWYGPGGFSKHVNQNWEFKKHLNGDLGVNTGEQGTLMRYVTKCRLFDKTLLKLEPLLKKLKYVGYVDIAVMIDEDGNIKPLEFTCRPGWPHFQILHALHEGDPANWMHDLLHGHDTLKVSKEVGAGVVMSVPNFPYKGPSPDELKHIPVWCDHANPNIHPCEIQAGPVWDEVKGKIVKVPGWVLAGAYAAVVTGTGPTVSKATTAAYKRLKDDIQIPNSPGYRTDIGQRLKKQIPEFQKHGFAHGLEF